MINNLHEPRPIPIFAEELYAEGKIEQSKEMFLALLEKDNKIRSFSIIWVRLPMRTKNGMRQLLTLSRPSNKINLLRGRDELRSAFT